jgi:diacylglycerol kinase (ATP)
MERKLIYFVNPISGTKAKNELLELIAAETDARKIPFEIQNTNAAGEYEYLRQKIAAEQITDVIVCGGDGTVSQLANALSGIDTRIGIIPMGSGNGLALAAKIPKDPLKALQVIFEGRSTPIDSFYINRKFSCMLCGLGFDAQVAHDFAKQKKRGLFTYIKQTIKNFFSAKPYPFLIETENATLKCDAWFISIANSNQFGNEFTIAPQASLCDGLIDIVVVKKMNKLVLVWKILQQIRHGKIKTEASNDFENSSILYFNTKKIVIHNPSLAPLHIDGDPAATAERFEIEIIPSAFKLLMPAGK